MQFRRKIDRVFPVRDLLGDFAADAFDRRAARRASPIRIRSGVSKTSSNFRNRTGPIFGTMLSAMQASVEFMRAISQIVTARTSRNAMLKRNLVVVRLGGGAPLAEARCDLPTAAGAAARAAHRFASASAATAAAGRPPSSCIVSPMTLSLLRFWPDCLSSQVSSCRRPSIKTGRPFFKYSPAISAVAAPKSDVDESDFFALLAAFERCIGD